MGTTVGRPIVVRDVLSKSTNLLLRTPALLIPQVIALVVSLLADVASTATFSAVRIVLLFAGVVVSIIIMGAYPSMVQAALAGGPLSVEHSLRQAAKRFGSLLAAGILVFLIVFLGSIALLVPGIIFVTWYAYTVPAIMLENKGALAGMSASKMFGRDKKWSTFILGVVVFIVIIVIAIIQAAVGRSSPLLGGVACLVPGGRVDIGHHHVRVPDIRTVKRSRFKCTGDAGGLGPGCDSPISHESAAPSGQRSGRCFRAGELLQVLRFAPRAGLQVLRELRTASIAFIQVKTRNPVKENQGISGLAG